MYELYQTLTGSRGSLAEVWIDKHAGLCKKLYKPDGIAIRGQPPVHQDPGLIQQLWENEIRWSTDLRGEWLVQTFEYGTLKDEFGFYIIQEYLGPDLLHHYDPHTRLAHVIPDAPEQILAMFNFFKSKDVYKLNHAMANMSLRGDRIVAFDFKYAVKRAPEHRQYEQHSIDTWVSKIDPSLPCLLSKLI